MKLFYICFGLLKMKCSLVKLEKLSGDKSGIYSVIIDDEHDTLFEKFIKENVISFESEINNILVRLKTIGHKTGARESFFKIEGEWHTGLVALYDTPKKNLRLYCIKFGSQLIIVGGGGPKKVRAFQEDKKLKKENDILRWLTEKITKKIREKEIQYSDDYLNFIGNLEFTDEN